MKTEDDRLRILIVEDEPLIRFILTRVFSEIAETKTAESAEEALEEIGTRHYDLCFLDYNLPGMNGLEALKIIKEKSKKTKVVIMSGSYFDEDMQKQVEETAYAFIEKPFELKQILDVVKNNEVFQALRSPQAGANTSNYPNVMAIINGQSNEVSLM